MLMDCNLISTFSLITTTIVIITFSILLFFRYFLQKPKTKSTRKPPPEAGGSWPFIGHLATLSKAGEPLHKTLSNMSNKHGSIFTIKMGVHTTLVVNSWELAKECLTTNDRVFANRPKAIATDIMSYNYSLIGVSPYGPYWRGARKIATLELLSNHRLKTLRHVLESEVSVAIKELHDTITCTPSNNKVDMKKWFGDINMNVIFRMVFGKRFGDIEGDIGQRCERTVKEFVKLLAVFMVGDAIPWLRWLDIGGHERAMRRVAKEFDQILQEWLEEHKRDRANCGDGHKDFMDVILSNTSLDGQEKEDIIGDDTTIKALCLTLILGGIDTSSTTVTWALSLLLNNKETLKKVQQELDEQVGRERQVKESDLNKLVYLQAVLKEALRLYPAAPIALPHESTEDCTVGGYHIPAKTRLILNIHNIQRDPNVWSDPSDFKPERFLAAQCAGIDFKGQSFEFMPFGGGRRMCPAVSLALQIAQLSLASFVHCFEVSKVSDEPIDMSESDGLINFKASPLDVLVSPRLYDLSYK